MESGDSYERRLWVTIVVCVTGLITGIVFVARLDGDQYKGCLEESEPVALAAIEQADPSIQGTLQSRWDDAHSFELMPKLFSNPSGDEACAYVHEILLEIQVASTANPGSPVDTSEAS